MANSEELVYDTIDRPYDDLMNREAPLGSATSSTSSENSPTGANTQYNLTNSAQTSTPTAQDQIMEAGGIIKSGETLSDVWLATWMKSRNYQPKTQGFIIDARLGYIECMRLFVGSGGIIGGSLDIPDTTSTNSFHVDSSGNMWLGSTIFATAPFSVSNTGDMTATSGTIGGWDINSTTLVGGNTTLDSVGRVVVGTSNDVAIMSSADATYRIWAGHATPASAPFSVTKAGAIFATSGTIGGNTLSATAISSNSFVSGPLGSGWRITNTGEAEFQNATVRGVIRTSVFEKDTISAVNGIVLISKADVLASDMTALDASTLTITGETTFVANEVIRIKDGTNDEWMLVTSAAGAPTYVVTRDLAGSYASNNNPIWKKGTAVVSMGVGTGSKTGFVLLDSSSASSPYIDVYGRNSNTYSDYSLHGRFGWLQGIVDADVGLSSTDVWGLYTDNAYLKGTIVANSGKIGGTSNYWNITSGSLAAVGSGNVEIRAGQTAYDTGTGFWLGLTSSTAKFSVGNSSGNKLTWDGSALGITGDITGSTITGGTIQTATSGQRIRMVASSASSPTQSANSLMLINSSSNGILSFGTSLGSSTSILNVMPSDTDQGALAVTNNVKLTATSALASINVADLSGSTAIALSVQNAGSGATILVSPVGSGVGITLNKSGTAANAFELTQSTDSRGIYLVKSGTGVGTALDVQNAGTGSSILINQSASGGGSTALSVNMNNSSGNAMAISHTGTATAVPTASFVKNGPTGTVLDLIRVTSIDSASILGMSNATATSTHFNKMITMGGVGSASIWISDGTTPNGNLTGTQGDICIGADGGKSYYCTSTGTTNWTAM